jgi:hypothetical protein
VTAPREPSDTTLPPDPGLFTPQVTPTPAQLSVATVSSTGTVVAVAPGSTVLSETPMLLGFTRRVSVNTIVRAPGSDSGRLPGSERQLSPGGGISRDRPRLVSRKRDAVDHDACEPVHPRYSKLYQNLQRSRGDRGGRCELPGRLRDRTRAGRSRGASRRPSPARPGNCCDMARQEVLNLASRAVGGV